MILHCYPEIITEPGKGSAWHKKTVDKSSRLHSCVVSCCPPNPVSEFIGHPHLAEPGCWGVVQLRDQTLEPGSQNQQPDPCGSPLLLSAGERGNIHHTGITYFYIMHSHYYYKSIIFNFILQKNRLAKYLMQETECECLPVFLCSSLSLKNASAHVPPIHPNTSMGNNYLLLIGISLWLPHVAQPASCLLCVPRLSSLSKQRKRWRTTTVALSTQPRWRQEPSDDRGRCS